MEYEFVPFADQPLVIICAYGPTGAAACDDCSSGNKVCQQNAAGILADLFDTQVALPWGGLV